MSEPKRGGLFVNKKGSAGPAAPSAPAAAAKPKDVNRRWMYVGVGFVGVIVLASTMFGDQKPAPRTGKKDEAAGAMINVTPANADKAAFEANFSKELERLKQDQERMKTELAKKDQQINELKTEGKAPAMPADIVPPPSKDNTGGLSSLGATTPPPPPTPVIRAPQVGAPASTGKAPELPAMMPSSSVPAEPLMFEAPAKNSDASTSGTSTQAGATSNAKTTYKKNASAGMLPAGSFAPVSLLNGLDAGTSTATQSNPMPVLMNVTEQATLPGAAKYRLKSCFVLGTGYGDLSAERVYVRFSRLSCVDKSDRLVLSQQVAGYLVDSDGKLGLRGVITDRQGAKLGKAMLAGFAQGLSGALGQAQQSVVSNSSTGTSTSSITGAAALRQSGLSGAQVAASQLAEFYLKEAQSIFPVISVDAGRTGTIVFTETASLNWTNGDTQYVQQVTPIN